MALLAASLPPWTTPVRATETVEANLEVVGRAELAGSGWLGALAVVGTTAIVAADPPGPGPGTACAAATVRVVDVKDPKRPAVVAELELPAGRGAADVAAINVGTEAYSGDLVAIALRSLPGPQGPCPAPDAGEVLYFDVTDPAAPRVLGRTRGCPGCPPGATAVSLAQRGANRVLSVWASGGTVVVEDVADPAGPTQLARWTAPAPARSDRCPGMDWVRDVELHDDGQAVLVVAAEGRVYDLDLLDPASPGSPEGTDAGGAGENAAAFAAVMPVGARTLGLVSEEGLDDSCTGGIAGRGLRVFELTLGATPVETVPVRFPGQAGPGRLVASGELAYVAWHSQGLRVVDLGQVRPRVVAQFIPEHADVVAVGLLPNHIVVADRTSGLYVLERPDEAGAEPSFWSQFAGVLPYIGGAMVMAAILVVPRLAMGRSPLGSRAGSPAPSPARRRRA